MEIIWTKTGKLDMHARVFVERAPVSAPSVVLVHGLGVSGRYMIPTAEALSTEARVYVPDLPGFGRSAKPARVLDVEELSNSLAAWMDSVGLEQCVFVANSFGCQVVVDLAARRPERVTCAVLVAPTVDPRRRTATRQMLRFLLNIPRERLSLLPIAFADYLTAGIYRGWRTLRYALSDPVEEKLPLITMPILIVRGGRDPIVPQDWAEEAARLVRSTRLHVIPHAAHAVNHNSPEELARVVLSFLREQHEPDSILRSSEVVSL
ncbi:MAG: alpha/beta hydrolase [Acidobacteriota bacterium]|nr:alpha/beta hydrolase [Acidobacteriota bacterium]